MKKAKTSFFACSAALAGTAFLLGGCSGVALLDPKGPIADTALFSILAALGLMLLIVVPVLGMIFWIPFKYRASNTRADYQPKWSFSHKIEVAVWTAPVLIVAALSVLVWDKTFEVDPLKPLPSAAPALTIEAVSLDWKWLFIYPDKNVASVNELVVPVGVPLSFEVTSDTVMTSFFVPQLGSQIYAMPGCRSRLNLRADAPGVYRGQNQNLSGEGYNLMHFPVRAVSAEEFESWLAAARKDGKPLDMAAYHGLTAPTLGYPETVYSGVETGLFEHILHQYGMGGMSHMDGMNHAAAEGH